MRRRRKGYKPPEGSPEFFSRCTVFRGLQPSEAEAPAERSEAVPPSEARPSRRAKRGRPAERSEAARRSSGGRHYKKTQKGSTRESPGEPLIITYSLLPGFFNKNIIFKKKKGWLGEWKGKWRLLRLRRKGLVARQHWYVVRFLLTE